jgi:hypothetical protein
MQLGEETLKPVDLSSYAQQAFGLAAYPAWQA